MLYGVDLQVLHADDVMVRKDGCEYATSEVESQLMSVRLEWCCDKLVAMRWKS